MRLPPICRTMSMLRRACSRAFLRRDSSSTTQSKKSMALSTVRPRSRMRWPRSFRLPPFLAYSSNSNPGLEGLVACLADDLDDLDQVELLAHDRAGVEAIGERLCGRLLAGSPRAANRQRRTQG